MSNQNNKLKETPKPKYKLGDIVGVWHNPASWAGKKYDGNALVQAEITEAYCYESGTWQYSLKSPTFGLKWSALKEENIVDLCLTS